MTGAVPFREYRFEAFPIQEKAAWLADAPGAAVVDPTGDLLTTLAHVSSSASDRTREGIRKLGVEWSGPASDAARQRSDATASGLSTASASATGGGDSLAAYSQSFTEMRGRVVYDDPARGGWLGWSRNDWWQAAFGVLDSRLSYSEANAANSERADHALRAHNITTWQAANAFVVPTPGAAGPADPVGGHGGGAGPGAPGPAGVGAAPGAGGRYPGSGDGAGGGATGGAGRSGTDDPPTDDRTTTGGTTDGGVGDGVGTARGPGIGSSTGDGTTDPRNRPDVTTRPADTGPAPDGRPAPTVPDRTTAFDDSLARNRIPPPPEPVAGPAPWPPPGQAAGPATPRGTGARSVPWGTGGGTVPWGSGGGTVPWGSGGTPPQPGTGNGTAAPGRGSGHPETAGPRSAERGTALPGHGPVATGAGGGDRPEHRNRYVVASDSLFDVGAAAVDAVLAPEETERR